MENISATTAVTRARTAASVALLAPNQSPKWPKRSGHTAGSATEMSKGKIARLHLEMAKSYLMVYYISDDRLIYIYDMIYGNNYSDLI